MTEETTIQDRKSYFIKSDYTPNDAVLTQEKDSDEVYWDEARVSRSLSFQHAVYAFAGQLIARDGIKRVVDVGCGMATKLAVLHRRFPQVEFIGIDQTGVIALCRERHSFGQWVADDLELPDPGNMNLRGDLVICADVIEHLGNPDLLLSYLKTRVRKNGRILLSTPERDRLRGPDCNYSPNRFHVREWNRSELRAYLESSGFSILQNRMQLPVRCEFSRLFFSQVVKRALMGRPIRSNQVYLLGVA